MIVLGIDPGLARTGFGVIESTGNNLKMITYGVIETAPSISTDSRLKEIFQEIKNLIKKYKPQKFSIEKIFFCKNEKTIIEVSEARGVVLLAACQNNLSIYEFTPLEVKCAIAGYGKADKKQVQKMIQILLKLEKVPRPDDAADALAIAICASNKVDLLEK